MADGNKKGKFSVKDPLYPCEDKAQLIILEQNDERDMTHLEPGSFWSPQSGYLQEKGRFSSSIALTLIVNFIFF